MPEQSRRTSLIVSRVKRQLEKNFAKQWTLDEIAELAGTTPQELNRAFRAVLGMSVTQYLARVRVDEARQILLAGESVSTAARLSGFKDSASLSFNFHSITGIFASQYRYQVLGYKNGTAATAVREAYVARAAR